MRIWTVILAFLGATAFASLAMADPFVINDFSTGGFDAYYGDWSNPGAVVYSSGMSSGSLTINSTVDGVATSYPDETGSGIGTNNLLSITAETLPGNVSASFVFRLTDANGVTNQYDFSTSSFPEGQFTTVVVPFYPSPDNPGVTTTPSGSTFDMNSLSTYSLTGPYDGSGDAFDMAFSDIEVTSAAPEPSSLCALGGAVGTAMLLRRRVKHQG